MVESARGVFKLIYKVGMIAITLTFAAGAVFAYLEHTPANQLLLVSGILALLALIAGLSISKLDDQDREAETYRQIGEDIRGLVKVSTSYSYAEPEVHRVDSTVVARAKSMASEGAPIDDICSMIDPEHPNHDPAHKAAFRKIVQTMIEQA